MTRGQTQLLVLRDERVTETLATFKKKNGLKVEFNAQ